MQKNDSLPYKCFLVLQGEDVTEAQAAEILIRTQLFWFGDAKDKTFTRQILEAAGAVDVPKELPFGYNARTADGTELEAEYQCLLLRFLDNNRIQGSHGTSGWCDWTGKIGPCYPDPTNSLRNPITTYEKLREEWAKIATAWPFLDLRCQVQHKADGYKVAAEYRVAEGKVELVREGIDRFPVEEDTTERLRREKLVANLPPQYYERGISLARFRRAIQTTRRSLGLPPLP